MFSVDLQCAILPVPMEAIALNLITATVTLVSQGHNVRHQVSPILARPQLTGFLIVNDPNPRVIRYILK
jgi:hypothetical protein